jgi:type I restriction enzyme S subunit
MTELTRLGDVVDLLTGFPFKSAQFVDESAGVRLLRGDNIGHGVLRWDGAKYWHSDKGDTLEKYTLVSGDVIVAMDRPWISSGLKWAEVRHTDLPCLLVQRVARLRAKGPLDQSFLPYLMSGKQFSDYVQGVQTGTAVPHISPKQIADFRFHCPSGREQRAIAEVLGALDDKIAVNERITAAYEQLLQCKYKELGLSDEPDGSAAVPVTDLVSFNPKLTKPTADEPIYVDMAALQTNRASIPTWTRRAPKSGPRFTNGDTLLARITPCLENGKTGYVDFMCDGEIGLGSTEFIVMRSRSGVPAELSYFLARDSRFREHAIRNMVGTSGRQRVSAADAANFLVNKPDAAALAAFGQEAQPAFAHMKSLQSESRSLAALRDTLLPQLMSGRLRVKDAEKIVEDHT